MYQHLLYVYYANCFHQMCTTAAFDLVMIVIACITLLPCALGPSKTLKKLQLCLPCHALLDLSQQMQKMEG